MKPRDELVREAWGRRLHAARKEDLGLTQVQFARQLGVAQSTVSGWESGAFAPDDAMKFRISELVGRRVDDLFAWPLILPPEHEVVA